MHLGLGEMLVVVVIALLVFGPSKLPELGDALGKGIRNFREASREAEAPPPSPEARAMSLPPASRPAHPAGVRAREEDHVRADASEQESDAGGPRRSRQG